MTTQNLPDAGSAALAALDALPEAAAVVAVTGAVVHGNRRWHQALTARAESDTGTAATWTGILQLGWGAPAAAVDAAADSVQHLQADAAPYELRWSVEAASGRRRLLASLRALPAQPGLLLLLVREVTAEQALADESARLRHELTEANERLRCFAAITSETLVINERGKILFVNEATQRMFGYSLDEAVGRSVLDFAAPECHQEIIAHLSKNNDDTPYEVTCMHRDGRRFTAEVRGRLITYHGRPVRGAALLDVTERKRTERELRDRLISEERVRAQAEALAELSTPLIPIRQDVLVMPLIGELDATRMARVTETMLEGIGKHRVRCAILDVTGVPRLDMVTAAALVRVAQGGRLLGAKILLSGVRAEVAHQLVTTGADLSGLMTYRSLESAIAAAFAV